MNPKQNSSKGHRDRGASRPLECCLVALLAALAFAGCSPDSKTIAGTDPAGFYTLVSVDGKQVPCSMTHEGTDMTVKSGTFTISADGTCSSRMVLSAPPKGDVNRAVSATYTRDGATLTMKWEDGGATTGSIEGNKFSMDHEGMEFVYRK
jgi:hypothetical protein